MVSFKELMSRLEPTAQYADLFKETQSVAIVGAFQNGKSTLLNSLLSGLWARPGDGTATTSIATIYRYGDVEQVCYRNTDGNLYDTSIDELFLQNTSLQLSKTNDYQAEIFLPAKALHLYDLIDTPGFNRDDIDTSIAMQALRNVCFVVFVARNMQLTEAERRAVQDLSNTFGSNFCVLMNCWTRGRLWLPTHPKNIEIAQNIEDELMCKGIFPAKIEGHGVFPCNLLWAWSQCVEFGKSKKYFFASEYVHEEINDCLSVNGLGNTGICICEHSGVPKIERFLKKIMS